MSRMFRPGLIFNVLGLNSSTDAPRLSARSRSSGMIHPLSKPPENVPKVLDAMIDVVLAYKPKPKSKPARKRKKLAAKIARATKSSGGPSKSEPQHK